MLQKIIALSLLVSSFVFGQEPSAFNAGGNAPQKSESQIINEKLFNLSNKVQMIEESQEGLKSIFEGQIQRIQNTANKIDLVQGESNATATEIKKHMDSNFALQNENIDKLKNSISALGALIQKTNTQMQNEINELREQINTLKNNTTLKDSKTNGSTLKEAKATPVKQSEEDSKEIVVTNAKINEVIAKLEDNSTKKLESNIDEKNATKPQESKTIASEEKQQKPKQTTTKPTQDSTTKPKANLKDKPLSEVFKKGENFLKNKNYESADEYLQFAVKGNYKPARGNYLLGEVAFEQKRYEDAIYYYKTSATRYDKADYMPRLMLNSAKSFNAIKEKENAKRFLETLISLYPKSNEAKEAKNLLKSF